MEFIINYWYIIVAIIAALVVAGLMAEGETVITGCEYIERGYENICKDLRELGARINSV